MGTARKMNGARHTSWQRVLHSHKKGECVQQREMLTMISRYADRGGAMNTTG